MRGWPNNLKHHELNEYYNNHKWPKIWYTTYLWRALRYWQDKETAIQKYIKIQWKSLIKWLINDNGRECTKCKEYKTWSEYSKSKTWIKWYTGVCKQCRNTYKAEYRKITNYSVDMEYKKRTRKLEIWQRLHFGVVKIDWVIQPMEYRKVIEKKKMQAYKLKSLSTWYFCLLDPTEWNCNYKKFYHADNLTISKEIESKKMNMTY